jgi:hypothetical protein
VREIEGKHVGRSDEVRHKLATAFAGFVNQYVEAHKVAASGRK